MTTVTIKSVTEPDELYCRYSGQHGAQPTYLNLDIEDASLWCDYNPNIGSGVDMREWNGIILAVQIPHLTASAANALMAEVAELAQTVFNGASVEWDGNNNVGRLDENARSAWDQITGRCDTVHFSSIDTVAEWEPEDWFAESSDEELGISADATDEELAAIAAQHVEEAKTIGEYGYNLLDADHAEKYLVERRDQKREQAREELAETAEALMAAEEKRDELIRRIHGWGVDSWRSLGDITGLSHTHVGRIINQKS